MEIFSLGVIMSKASGASCHLPSLCHGDRYWYRLVFSWKTKHFYLFKPLTCSVNCTRLDKSTIFPIKFVLIQFDQRATWIQSPSFTCTCWCYRLAHDAKTPTETRFTSSLTPFLVPVGVHEKMSDVCVCVCWKKDRKKNQSCSSSILAIWLASLSGLQQRKLICGCQLRPV